MPQDDQPRSYINALSMEHDRGYKLGVVHGIERAAEQVHYAINAILDHSGMVSTALSSALQDVARDLRTEAEAERRR